MSEASDIFEPSVIIDAMGAIGDFARYEPGVKTVIIMICATLIICCVLLISAIHMRLHDRKMVRKYRLDQGYDDDMILRYTFSEKGRLKIYGEGYCVIVLAGANVSPKLEGILSVNLRNISGEPMLLVICEDNIKHNIRCGDIDSDRFEILRKYMLQYAGG